MHRQAAEREREKERGVHVAAGLLAAQEQRQLEDRIKTKVPGRKE